MLRSTEWCGNRFRLWNTMPMCRRASRSAAPPSGSGLPSKWIEPASILSRPLMQRRSVVLPEPERPITATTSPASTSSDTSSRTTFVPNCLRSLANAKSGIDPPFETQRQKRHRPAQCEVQKRDDRVHDHRLERHVDDQLPGARQLDETDDRGDRRPLDELNQESDGRRNCNTHRL